MAEDFRTDVPFGFEIQKSDTWFLVVGFICVFIPPVMWLGWLLLVLYYFQLKEIKRQKARLFIYQSTGVKLPLNHEKISAMVERIDRVEHEREMKYAGYHIHADVDVSDQQIADYFRK